MRVNEQNYVDEAEQAILELKNMKDRNGRPVPMVTTSKLRNLLSMTADIYNAVLNDTEERALGEKSGGKSRGHRAFKGDKGEQESLYPV